MKIFKWDEINGQDQEVKMEAFLSAVNDTYAILQLKDEEETRPMHFISYAALQKSGDTPDIDHYEVVYVAPLLPYKDQNTLLDEIYEKLNIAHPADFHGHSLSVSDIVAIRTNGQVSCHYVDSIGFVTMPEFLKPENYLKNAEMAMEDDYGMIDGIINNGKAPAMEVTEKPKEERESILEKLKAAKEPGHKPPAWFGERNLE